MNPDAAEKAWEEVALGVRAYLEAVEARRGSPDDDLRTRAEVAKGNYIAGFRAGLAASPSEERNQTRLAHLALLEENWDSYGGHPPTADAVASVREIMDAIYLIPMGTGGIQIELHAAGHDFEVEVGADGRVEGAYWSKAPAALRTTKEWEG